MTELKTSISKLYPKISLPFRIDNRYQLQAIHYSADNYNLDFNRFLKIFLTKMFKLLIKNKIHEYQYLKSELHTNYFQKLRYTYIFVCISFMLLGIGTLRIKLDTVHLTTYSFPGCDTVDIKRKRKQRTVIFTL